MNTNEYIELAKKIHSNKYNYSKVIYHNAHSKICIICPKHGEFTQIASDHLNGCGCPKCANNEKGKYQISNTKKFIIDAKKIHGEKYDYSKVEYFNNRTKVCIICPIHGEFWQRPHNHLQGDGCPKCNESKLEKYISDFLEKNNFDFIPQYKAEWLGKQSLDFFLPKYNVAIECQGIQHFKPNEYFGGEKAFKIQKNRDILKKEKCNNMKIKLLYFSNVKNSNTINNEKKLLKEILNETRNVYI